MENWKIVSTKVGRNDEIMKSLITLHYCEMNLIITLIGSKTDQESCWVILGFRE